MEGKKVGYTSKQIKALEVFGEYISCEIPFQDMDKRVYKKLGRYYSHLPPEVFSIPKSNSLYHTSKGDRKAEKLTDSWIVSCTTPQGKEHINSEWCLREGDVWWRLRKRKAVEARKLFEVACDAGVLEYCQWLETRVHNEDEYILPLEKVKVVSKRVISQ